MINLRLIAFGCICSFCNATFENPDLAAEPGPQNVSPESGTAPATTAPAATRPVNLNIPMKQIQQFVKRGSGPISVVLIPGLACDWTVFESFMQRNSDRYTMYAVTLPGFGGTEPPQMPVRGAFGTWIDSATKAIWQFMQENRIEKPVVVGHSLGGHLALRLGTRYPAGFLAIISLDGMPAIPLGAEDLPPETRGSVALQAMDDYKRFPDESWPAEMGQMISTMVSNPDRAVELATIAGKPPRDVTLQYLGDFWASDLRSDLSMLRAPALVIAAIATRDVPPAEVQGLKTYWPNMVRRAPNLKLVYFEQSRHFVQDDHPAEVDAAIADFLAGREVHGIVDPAPRGERPKLAPPSTRPAPPSTAP